jgi:hypothetical protein
VALPLDYGTVAAEPLPALLADGITSVEGIVQLILHCDPVSAETAAKPGGERLLVGERAGIHWPKLRREQFGGTSLSLLK